jgi:hypothetical protein
VTLLCDNIFKRFGLPDEIISDRDPRFAAHTFQELLKLLNIKLNFTTAYHPQSDGATKRINQEIEAYLSIYCMSHPEDWLHFLSTLEFTHNNRRHAEQIHSPFELIQGNNLISVPITFSHTKFPTIEEKMKWIISDREEALAAHELARTKIANQKQSKFIPFEKNQKNMAGSEELENESSPENCTKMRRTIQNQQSTGTSDLSTETTGIMENPQCIPCNTTPTIHQEQSLWEQLP